ARVLSANGAIICNVGGLSSTGGGGGAGSTVTVTGSVCSASPSPSTHVTCSVSSPGSVGTYASSPTPSNGNSAGTPSGSVMAIGNGSLPPTDRWQKSMPSESTTCTRTISGTPTCLA